MLATARGTAFQGPDGAARDPSRVAVSQPVCADEHQGIALNLRQASEAAIDIAHEDMPFLLAAPGWLYLGRPVECGEAPLAPLLVEIGIAQNPHQPRGEIRSGSELVGVGERPQDRFLHEIVGEATIPGEAAREALELGQVLNNIVAKHAGHFIAP